MPPTGKSTTPAPVLWIGYVIVLGGLGLIAAQILGPWYASRKEARIARLRAEASAGETAPPVVPETPAAESGSPPPDDAPLETGPVEPPSPLSTPLGPAGPRDDGPEVAAQASETPPAAPTAPPVPSVPDTSSRPPARVATPTRATPRKEATTSAAPATPRHEPATTAAGSREPEPTPADPAEAVPRTEPIPARSAPPRQSPPTPTPAAPAETTGTRAAAAGASNPAVATAARSRARQTATASPEVDAPIEPAPAGADRAPSPAARGEGGGAGPARATIPPEVTPAPPAAPGGGRRGQPPATPAEVERSGTVPEAGTLPPVPPPPVRAPERPVERLAEPERLPPLPGPARPRVEATSLSRGNPALPQVVLSFDGGSGANSARAILEALDAAGVRTTFFLTGEFVRSHPDVTRQIAERGHEIGNHTDDHPHLTLWNETRRHTTRPEMDADALRRELAAADASFRMVTGRPMAPLWRAPYGEINSEILGWAADLGYRHVGWTSGFDSLDWVADPASSRYRTAEEFVDLVASRARPGGAGLNGVIILMHLNSWRPEEERFGAHVGSLVKVLRAAGYELVTAGTLLQNLEQSGDSAPSR